MARIPDVYLDAFEAVTKSPFIDTYTDAELEEIARLASEIRTIREAAIKRQQDANMEHE